MAVADTIAQRRDEAGARRREEHRARRHVRRRAGARSRHANGPARGRLEPRVPEGRRRGLRLLQARSRRRRRATAKRRARCCASSTRRSSSPASASSSPIRRSSELIKYASNTMLADAHLVHERALAPLSRDGRRHPLGAPRRRHRLAHRQEVPLRRPRLRRLVLPQGRAGARRARPRRTTCRCASPRPRTSRTRSRRAFLAQLVDTRSTASKGKTDRALGPRLQARDGRHPRVAGGRASRRRLLDRGATRRRARSRRPARTSRSCSATRSP